MRKINKGEFKRFVFDLCTYYGKRQLPESSQVDLWYDEVKWRVDAEALTYVGLHVKGNRDSMPINLPKVMKEGYRLYLVSNPAAAVTPERQHCDECGGRGMLWGRIHREALNRTYECVFRCNKCENWKRHFPVTIDSYSPGEKRRFNLGKVMPLVDKEEMRIMGFEPSNLYMPAPYRTTKQTKAARNNSQENDPPHQQPAEPQ